MTIEINVYLLLLIIFVSMSVGYGICFLYGKMNVYIKNYSEINTENSIDRKQI